LGSAVIRLPVEWSYFYVVNFLVIVLGVVAANLADVAPALALLSSAGADQWHFVSYCAGNPYSRPIFARPTWLQVERAANFAT
jgi:hypothetical protein